MALTPIMVEPFLTASVGANASLTIGTEASRSRMILRSAVLHTLAQTLTCNAVFTIGLLISVERRITKMVRTPENGPGARGNFPAFQFLTAVSGAMSSSRISMRLGWQIPSAARTMRQSWGTPRQAP